MSREGADLDAARLGDLFNELSAELEARDQTAQLFVVGGAAMALAYDDSRLTRDVDAVKLYGIVGYTSPEQGHALLQRRYPQAQLLPRHRYIVEDVAAQASELRQQGDLGMTAARAAFPGTAHDAVRAPGAPQADPGAARGSCGHERGTGTQR